MDFKTKTSNDAINQQLDNYDSLSVEDKQALLSAYSIQLVRDGIPKEDFLEDVNKMIDDIKENI